jgi:hypothetical protein
MKYFQSLCHEPTSLQYITSMHDRDFSACFQFYNSNLAVNCKEISKLFTFYQIFMGYGFSPVYDNLQFNMATLIKE